MGSELQGPLLIHAGKNFKVSEFEQICEYAKEDGKRPPQQENILVGGIVGMVDFYKVVEESDNIWFGGPLRLGFPQDTPPAVPTHFLCFQDTPTQSPSPGLAEKYLSNFPTSSQ